MQLDTSKNEARIFNKLLEAKCEHVSNGSRDIKRVFFACPLLAPVLPGEVSKMERID
jgi:hypothetical protein